MRVNLTSKKLILSVFILLFVASSVLFLNQKKIGTKTDRPHNASPQNIVFIILDAARADHFSCYGYEKDTTPNMDAVGQKGAIFLNHFSNATLTRDAVPRIFFSRYFSIPIFQGGGKRWKIRQLQPQFIVRKFDEEQIFLTDILSRHGYRTALFENRGWLTKNTYMGQKFDESFSFKTSHRHPADKNIISAVISWLKKNKERKFFIYCHIMSPHEPYPPKEEDNEFLEGENPSIIKRVKETLSESMDPTTNRWNQEGLRILRGLYDGNLKHTDKWIGILYDGLKELNLEDKTLLIITSDHGECLGEHGWLGHKGPPWDSVIHVPLIMVYPPLIPPGKKVDGLTESIDIMPTILDICKIELPPGKAMDGRSLLEVIRNPKAGKKAVFTKRSIRTAKYKYIIRKRLLYDLRKDPGEKRNIAKQKLLIRKMLEFRFNKAMKPYKKRYEESKEEESPEFPFYFPIKYLNLSPRDIFQRYFFETYSDRRNVVLKKAPSGKAWLLNKQGQQSRLFCLPVDSPPPPITLSAPLPNGTYRISVLLESPDKIPLSPEKAGFQFRFDAMGPFVFPGHVRFFTEYKNHFYYYLDLEEVRVNNKKFSIQLSFLSPNKGSWYAIRHIKFVPAKSRKEDTGKVPSKEEFRRKTEHLKSLGYL